MIIFAMFLALCSPAQAHDTVIVVRPNIRVTTQTDITVGDVLDTESQTAQLPKEYFKIKLFEAPKRGEKRTFSNLEFAQILREKILSSDFEDKVDLRIPSKVTVESPNPKLTASEVENELMSELKKICGNCDFELAGLQLPLINTSLPEGSSWAIKIKTEIPKGSFSLPLEILNDDGTRRLYWISGNLIVRKTVPVAKHNITTGESIQPEDFKLEKHEITFVNDGIAAVDDLKAVVANRNIMAGQVIELSSVRKQSAVRFGDTVKVVIGSDGWQISTEGLAQQNAYIGDQVKVKIAKTQKIVVGTLTEKSLVEIQ